MAQLITMPEVLAGVDEAAIASWSVAEGDAVAAGDTIAEVETDKAVVDLPSQVAGTVGRLLVEPGETVAVGTPLVILLADGETVADVEGSLLRTATMAPAGSVGSEPPAAGSPAESAAQAAELVAAPAEAAASAHAPAQGAEPEAPTGTTAQPPPSAAGTPAAGTPEAGPATSTRLFASPIARRLAREHGVDLAAIEGTGPQGRITRRDLARHLETAPAAPAPAATTPAAPSGAAPAGTAAPSDTAAPAAQPGELVPHSRMRKAIARRLTEAKATVPHFYLRADCRVDALLELRREVNAASAQRVSVNDFVVMAVAKALTEVPEANVRWTEEGTLHLVGVDVAVAVTTDGGLLTPVVRDVAGRRLGAVSADIKDLAGRARTGALRQHELEGGTMTVSNLGMYGVGEFAAIINPPQCAILAVGAAEQRAVVVDGAVTAATVMIVTLSADHRVMDGELAARWLAAFVAAIENPAALLV